jgi:hypothetical protein
MADGEWGTIQLAVPDFLEDLRETINSVAEVLITALDVALAALRLAKAFLVAFLDPIAALVKAIADEIRALIHDLRQLGIYITGDWKLMNYPYDDLVGGFAEYERRMIARLTDTTDPTRPDVTSRTEVLSVFFYLSVDISDIQRLIKFIKQLISYFNQTYSDASGPPVPFITSLKYGLDAAETSNILQFGDIGSFFTLESTPPNVAQVAWKVPAVNKKNPLMPFPPLPPGGFLVTVSTIKDGLPLVYDRPRAAGGTEETGSSGQAQPREFGQVRDIDGRPIVLHGGTAMLSLDDALAYNANIDGGKVKNGVTRIYAMLPDNSVVPLEELYKEGSYVLQRSFFVPLSASLTQWAMGEYSELLKWEDMPWHATPKMDAATGLVTLEVEDKPAGLVYVRIAATSVSNAPEDSAGGFRYDLPEFGKVKDAPKLPVVPTVDSEFLVSSYSDARTVTFPTAYSEEYLNALRTALMILFLTRPDLVPLDQLDSTLSPDMKQAIAQGTQILNGVVKNRRGMEKLQHLNGLLYPDYRKKVEEKDLSPLDFRTDLLQQIDRAAQDIYSKTGPMPEAEKAIVEATENLRTVTWADIFKEVHPELAPGIPQLTGLLRPLESLQSNNRNTGLAINPYSMDINEEIVGDLFTPTLKFESPPTIFYDRDPDMLEAVIGVGDTTFTLPMAVEADDVEEFLATVSRSVLGVYEKSVQEDGSILVDPKFGPYLSKIEGFESVEGSADVSPVFVVNRQVLEDYDNLEVATRPFGICYVRGLLAKYQGGILYQEATIALGVAASAIRRSPEDGEWIAIRFFDQYPAIEEFLTVFQNWIEAIAKSLKSVLDTLLKYIEFIEARIIELQQLIKRINAIIQALLGYSFKIPKCSALALVSDGTGGVLSELVSAKNKPSDGPLAYGAGLAVVIPYGPAIAMDMIRMLLDTEEGEPGEGETMSSQDSLPAPIFSVDAIPEDIPIPPTEPPDVL